MGYERYNQNTDPRGDYEVHDDLSQPRSRGIRTSDWDRGDRSSSASRSSETYSGRIRSPNEGDRYGQRGGGDPYYGGGYASGGYRGADTGNEDRGDRWGSYGERPDRGGRYEAPRGNRYGLQPQQSQRSGRSDGYDYEDRGLISRAGDELRSWFGDEDAERRRNLDQRYDERLNASAGQRSGSDYDSWRRQQIEALDRDYDEYRRENESKFHSEFSSWREERQGQRSSLSKVEEQMEVVGSDGGHVGVVDKVRGDRIVLTKSDENAGGHHHSIPSRWIQSVDDKVTIRKSAAEAMKHWKDEERNQALFDDRTPSSSEQWAYRNDAGTY